MPRFDMSIDDAFNDLAAYVRTAESAAFAGYEAFVTAAPSYIKGQLQSFATTGSLKLTSTLAKYLEAVSVEVKDGGVIVVEIAADNWLANALENGMKPYDMMQTHLKGNPTILHPKTRQPIVNGYSYRIIPIIPREKRDQGALGGLTPNGARVQEKINKALRSRDWVSASQWSPKTDPNQLFSVTRYSGVVKTKTGPMKDPELNDLYRMTPINQAGKPTGGRSSYVMFRVMTDKNRFAKDGTLAWQHPGIQARNYIQKLDQWWGKAGEQLFTDALEAAFNRVIDPGNAS